MHAHNFHDLTGQRFGRLAVERYAGRHPANGRTLWLCRCDCGASVERFASKLRAGLVTSCGCKLRAGTNLRHGETHGPGKGAASSPEWRSWWGLIRRATARPGMPAYEHYAGRGIGVCERWQGQGGYASFLADMGRKPGPRYSIDRINNDGGYEPGNCRWATRSQQQKNRRLLVNPADGRDRDPVTGRFTPGHVRAAAPGFGEVIAVTI